MIFVDQFLSCCIFFFQAEDGIRDAQESRGLGDVYKRQIYNNCYHCCCVGRAWQYPGQLDRRTYPWACRQCGHVFQPRFVNGCLLHNLSLANTAKTFRNIGKKDVNSLSTGKYLPNPRIPVLFSAAVLAAALLPLIMDPFTTISATNVFIYIVITLSWALFSGPTQYISIATAAFFGIGTVSYTHLTLPTNYSV